jgi:ferredoxin--NADP+ reductase
MEEFNAVVLQRQDVGQGLMIVQVAPTNWTIPDFKPGQYTTLGLPAAAGRADGTKPDREPPKPNELIKRAYSIASSPRVKDYLEFYLALVDDGLLTGRFWKLREGDPVWMSPRIIGTFTLEHIPPDQHIVMIATGTGLGPFISQLHYHFDGTSQRHWAVFHGVRHSHALGYRSELQALQYRHPNFSYVPVISRPQGEPVPWRGPTGYVQQVWKDGWLEQLWGFRPTPQNTHVLICGNPAMLDMMVEQLATEGFSEFHHRKNPGGQIHLEKYW